MCSEKRSLAGKRMQPGAGKTAKALEAGKVEAAHLIAVWPWACHLSFLGLSIFVCEIGVMINVTSYPMLLRKSVKYQIHQIGLKGQTPISFTEKLTV